MRLLILLYSITLIDGFQYAQPLVTLQPDENGVYVIDMLLTRKLTMSYHNDNAYNHGTPVDYDPNLQQWWKRDPEQVFAACNASYLMNLDTNPGDQDKMSDVLSLDGLHQRVIAVNGISPGPTIVVPYKSEVLLRVKNAILMDSITIHVHGIDKKGLWYMDGVAFIQQCPIHSTNYFEYRFIADNKGTHWYHGHMQTDRGDGLAGGFVVVDNDRSVPTLNGKREVPDREYYAMLQDWATKSTEEAWMSLDDKTMKWMYGMDHVTQCWQPTRLADGSNVGGSVPISALLVNDKGWHKQHDVVNRPRSLPLERFAVKQGQSILFRIVNAGVAQELMLHIEGHNMTVVAADGDECIPIKVDRLIIFPGERYDVLIHTLNSPTKKNYLMKIETIQYYKFDWTLIGTTYGGAYIEYEDNTLIEDNNPPNWMPTECTQTSKCLVLNCPFVNYPTNHNFTCLSYEKLQNPPNDNIDPQILQNTPFTDGFEEHFINMHFDSHVDGYKFKLPTGMPYYYQDSMPLVSQSCEKSKCPPNASKYDRSCSCFYHKKHKLNNIVQMTLYNMGIGGGFSTGYAHPFHIHGTHFHVMKVGWPSYNASGMIIGMNQDIACPDAETNCDGAYWSNSSWMNGAIPGMNTINPSKRDTITLPVGGYITVRFRATNPGWWFAHCHLVLHAMGGTAYAFKIGENDEIPVPPPNFPHDCGYFSMPSLSSLSSTTVASITKNINPSSAPVITAAPTSPPTSLTTPILVVTTSHASIYSILFPIVTAIYSFVN